MLFCVNNCDFEIETTSQRPPQGRSQEIQKAPFLNLKRIDSRSLAFRGTGVARKYGPRGPPRPAMPPHPPEIVKTPVQAGARHPRFERVHPAPRAKLVGAGGSGAGPARLEIEESETKPKGARAAKTAIRAWRDGGAPLVHIWSATPAALPAQSCQPSTASPALPPHAATPH